MDRRWLALLAVILLSGCASADDPADDPLTTPTETQGPGASETEGPSPPASDNTPLESVFILSGCEDSLTTFSHPPAPLVDTMPPPGWATPFPPEVRYQVQVCQRVSIDSFERGPRFVLLEVHNSGIPPPGCEGDYTRARILSHIWIDDQELVDHLRVTYAMPAELAEFGLEQTTLAGLVTSRWTFGLPGEEPSTMETQQWDRDYDSSEVVNHRFFWMSGPDQISYLDQDGLTRFQSDSSPLVTGQIQPPLLYGSIGPWAGYGGHGTFEFEAPIHRFGDLECKSPL